MDDIELETLRELYPEIVEDLDPIEVLPQLFTILPMDFCLELRQITPRLERANVFLEKAFNCMTLQELFDSLAFQDACVFLITKIEERLKQKCQNSEVYCSRRGKLFTSHRRELVQFRHLLKRYSLTGDQTSFDREVQSVVAQWEDVDNKANMCLQDRQRLADRYFFVRDAQCENMRLKYEQNLSSTDILSEILNIAPFTTNPTLTTMMFLARKGSAMIMADMSSYDKAYTNYIQIAEQNTELLPACRETGLVFYIKYNFICLKYENNCNSDLKISLFKIAKKAVDHFCREYQNVAMDFHNIFYIKLAHLHLEIGVLGNNMDDVPILKEDIHEAESYLSKLKVKDLSNRWKWGYNIAKSKIYFLQDDLQNALRFAKKADSYAIKGKFKNEIKGTEDTINQLKCRLYDGDINKTVQKRVTNTLSKSNSQIRLFLLFLTICILCISLMLYVFNLQGTMVCFLN